MVRILIFESYKSDGEITEILRIKEFKLNFPFLKANSIFNIANQNKEFDEIHQISDQISKGRKNEKILSFNNFQFGDQFQLQEKNKSYFFFFKDFWQNYPKSIDVSNGIFQIKILPEIKKQEFNFQGDEIHRLGFWFDESDYLVKMGMSLSSTFLIDLSNLYTVI